MKTSAAILLRALRTKCFMEAVNIFRYLQTSICSDICGQYTISKNRNCRLLLPFSNQQIDKCLPAATNVVIVI